MILTSKVKMDCVILSEAIYKDKRGYELIAEQRGYPHTRFFDKDDTQLAVTYHDQLTIIAFRGTEMLSWEDIKTNLRTHKEKWVGEGEVHSGYNDKINAIFPRLRQHLKRRPTMNLIITGHSLGGALATICGARIETAEEINDPDYIITFGSTKLGDQEFVDSIKAKGLRYVNGMDHAPFFPFISGEAHYGKKIKVWSGWHLPIRYHHVSKYKRGLEKHLLKTSKLT